MSSELRVLPTVRMLGRSAGIVVLLSAALAACDTFRYDPGNSLEGRALKAGMRSYSAKNARKPEAGPPLMPAGGATSPEADAGIAAPYIPCESFAECRDKAQVLDQKIGWANSDFPVGSHVELHQLRQVASRALGFKADDPQCHGYRAKAREAFQDWVGTIDDWTAVLTKQPADRSALVRRAHLELVRSDPERGLGDVNRALALDPDDVAALIERAAIRQRLQDFGAALTDLDRVVALQPGNVTALSARASVHTQRRECAPALADLDRAIALRPADAGLYAQRGNVHVTLDAPDLARADYRRACDLGDPFWCTFARR